LEIAFSGGDEVPKGFEMPEFGITVKEGKLQEGSNFLTKKGNGFYNHGEFLIEGGKGFNAALRPVMSEGAEGKLIAVKVVRSGSNYPEGVRAYTEPEKKPLDVEIREGRVVNVKLKQAVAYEFKTIPSIFLTGKQGDLDWVNNPAKGKNARISFEVNKQGARGPIKEAKLIEPGERYLVDKLGVATRDSLPAILKFGGVGQVASANQAYGYIAQVAKPTVKVEQVLYDSVISRFSLMASTSLKPFGGAFGGATGPDGYGLGNALSSATKVLGVFYNLQQYYAGKNQIVPAVTPSLCNRRSR